MRTKNREPKPAFTILCEQTSHSTIHIMNTFGQLFRLTSFGESHGPAMGGVIDGMPAGCAIDLDAVQRFVDRRRPSSLASSTTRTEIDRVEVLSGIFEGRTLGTPIGFIVRNHDAKSTDYDALRQVYRPSHGDYPYQMKYGHRDHRGGGRASARETVSRVVAGAFALQVLQPMGVSIQAQIASIGGIPATNEASVDALIHRVRSEGDSVGGVVSCTLRGVPAGWGDPVFAKLEAALASAMLSIPAAKAFELGMGRQYAQCLGSECLDSFTCRDGHVVIDIDRSGGICAGISTGAAIHFDVTFKPVATLMREVPAIGVHGEDTIIGQQGRHDVCVVPRALPIVEAMAAIVLLDHLLLNQTSRHSNLHI